MNTFNKPIHVILLDSQTFIGEAISKLLSDKADIKFIGQFDTMANIAAILSSVKIDIVLLETSLPDYSGVEVCKYIKQHYEHTKVVFFSMQLDELNIGRAIKAGCDGYISKEANFKEIIDAMRRVIANETVYSKKVEQVLLKKIKHQNKSHIPPLTDREREVLKLLADGFSSKEIADKIFVTNKTVDFHRGNLIVKFDARNIVEATSDAIRLGIID